MLCSSKALSQCYETGYTTVEKSQEEARIEAEAKLHLKTKLAFNAELSQNHYGNFLSVQVIQF